LKTKIDADTDLATLRTDVKSIIDDYRVYLVLARQVRLTIALDRFNKVIDLFNLYVTKLQSLIDKENAAGKDVSDAQAALDSMKENVSAAQTAINGQVDAVLALTAQGYPGNASTMNTARKQINTAKRSLHTALTNAHSCRDFLKSLRSAGTLTTSTTY
jgi:multidrug resistance efflux pump